MLQNQNNRKLSLEFSFNRPQGAQTATSASGAPTNQSSNDSLASDRLRKAIERNRAKQMMRSGGAAPSESVGPNTQASMGARPQQAATPRAQTMAPPPVPPKQSMGTMGMGAPRSDAPIGGSSLAERLKAKREEALNSARKWDNGDKKSEAPTVTRQASAAPSESSHDLFATRKSVAKPENSELMGELKKKTQVPTTLAYAPVAAPSVRAKRKVKTKKDGATKDIKARFNNLVVKGGWLFCVFLMGRLIFSDGGIMDYYSQKTLLENKVSELEANKKENEMLAKEIELIKDDSNYQKKIVRDNLGMIAKDEFLILFPKESSDRAI